MKCRIKRHFIWVFTVCQSNHLGVSSIQRVDTCSYNFKILLIVEFYSEDFILDENLNLAQPDSDSENEDQDFGNCSTLQLSEFMGFKVEPEVASLVLQLRQKWNCLFLRRMRTPSKSWSQIDEVSVTL